MVNTNKNISHHVLSWYNANKRLLSFRDTKDPYKIWLSEIMLQQTKVSTVLPYYEKWIIKYPTIKSLYNANLDTLLKLWEGLGYYSRCNNFYNQSKLFVIIIMGKFLLIKQLSYLYLVLVIIPHRLYYQLHLINLIQ